MTLALNAITEILDAERKLIESDLMLWATGKKHPNLAFSGSLVDLYWGPYLDDHAKNLTDLSFATARSIASDHNIDPAKTIEGAWNGADNAVANVITRMAHYDRGMRGGGYPDSVPPKDTSDVRGRHSRSIRARAEGELALLRSARKGSIALPLSNKEGFWWFIENCHSGVRWPIILWALGAALAIATGAFTFARSVAGDAVASFIVKAKAPLKIESPPSPHPPSGSK